MLTSDRRPRDRTRPGRRRAPVHSKTHPAGTAMRRLTRVSDQLGGGPAASGSGSDAAATAAELEYEYDLLIVGGRVICPATNTDRLADLAVKDGLIAALLPAGSAASHGSAREVVDASGLLVTPGLVDLHAHGYQHVEPIGATPSVRPPMASVRPSVMPTGFPFPATAVERP